MYLFTIPNPYDLAGLNVAGNVESHGDNLVGGGLLPL
jgi:hypothetical protein